jgi:hypothetical protein
MGLCKRVDKIEGASRREGTGVARRMGEEREKERTEDPDGN